MGWRQGTEGPHQTADNPGGSEATPRPSESPQPPPQTCVPPPTSLLYNDPGIPLCALNLGQHVGTISLVGLVVQCLVEPRACACWAILPTLLPPLFSVLLPLQLQVNVLSKFLLIAKSCYEQRNFATAMQILGGLENLAVRQSPVRAPGPRPWVGGWRAHDRQGSHLCFHHRPGECCPPRSQRSWRS